MASDDSNSSTSAHGEWSVITERGNVERVLLSVQVGVQYSTVLC